MASVFQALPSGKAYQVVPIDKLSVVLVIIIAVIFLGERPGLRDRHASSSAAA